VLLVIALAGTAPGLEFDFNGRASGWLGTSWDASFLGVAGLRYLPEARLSSPICKQIALDAEASVNGFVSADARTLDRPEIEARIKPYRGFVRLSAAQFEARVGLQKINFGSAMLLRPLMWFDRVDPRDPLELTDGVYGLLGRYYFQNNINIWAWGLLGNSAPKGWEVYGSEHWVPEPGVRVQVPVPRGEVAATYHHRAFSHELAYLPPGPRETLSATENRVGIDGKWDIGVGLWLEGAVSQRNNSGDITKDSWDLGHLDSTFVKAGRGAGSATIGRFSPFGHAIPVRRYRHVAQCQASARARVPARRSTGHSRDFGVTHLGRGCGEARQYACGGARRR